ncbi:restriction endonuclease subunit S [Brochothrix thermosphacta]|uniref:restriction endonuclease subunit S n=1 Tax=Brochothrix thermosphacta TaxID=2756 RepID=UPI000BC2E255|nr:restriction endonuclease subunit S [Brochothrix thermosphacta]ATH85795.1 restriction endonuclease subunit S [Brochothrix thermosphacta]
MEHKNIPEIRFSGFTNEWEQRKLSEIVDIYDGTHQTPKYTDSGVKFVSVENISNLKTEKYISQQAYDKEYAKKQAKKGDVLMTRIGDIGTARVIETDEPLAYYVTLALLKPKIIESNFLSWLISSPKVQRNIWKRTLHIAFPKKINLGEINQVEVMIPKEDEQQKIGSFFKQLDDTITLHQRKLDLLKEQKKGFLQKMFPKNSETVPELRFSGFTNEWEQRKLGEISRMYQPLTITGNDLLPDGVPVFGANGFIGFFSEANHIEDQVTISARGEGTGTPSYVHGPVWITGNSMVVNVDDFDINKYFLFANLTANSFKKYVTGGAQPQLTRDVLVKVPITLPNADEQQKIGSFFQQLDNTITLHQRKLELLKEQKKGFLQKMFPKNS